jgi:parvulin-like peptidyl-prolyl isomerase
MAKSSRKRKDTSKTERQTKKQIAISRKESRQNRIILICVGVLVAIIVVVLAVGVVRELIIKPGQPVATVNGVKVPTTDYRDMVTYNRYNQYVNISNLQNQLQDLRASPEENEFIISFYEQQLQQLQSSLAFVPQSTLDEMINAELVRQKAVEEGISVSDEQVEETIMSDLRSALSRPPQEPITGTEQLPTPTPVSQKQIDELYSTVLDNMRISEKSFREIVRQSLLRQEVADLLADQVPTTGLIADVQLIQTETEEEAEAAKERIEGGEEFAIVAQEVSTDTLTAADGGSLGWVTTGQLSSRYGDDVEAAVFDGEVGKLALVESNGMFYVVLVSERDENGPLPEDVLSLRQSSALSDWLEELKASPEVQIEQLLETDQIPPDPFAALQGY